ncbi:hypothetical protein [Amycolatopsis panacis]|uniref:Uncharacterized protein n=1 Tax=Amycolatopsis panacis TaxID=2340917 RepID=A0A419I272_9PSEU|nr:hypothetical protein [Amycolatopsis panacis]RJQ83961.1 hypothetical protein D5S19_18375 [Amycolatopsis panacis]
MDQVIDTDDVFSEAMGIARRLAAGPVVALWAAKAAIDRGAATVRRVVRHRGSADEDERVSWLMEPAALGSPAADLMFGLGMWQRMDAIGQ